MAAFYRAYTPYIEQVFNSAMFSTTTCTAQPEQIYNIARLSIKMDIAAVVLYMNRDVRPVLRNSDDCQALGDGPARL